MATGEVKWRCVRKSCKAHFFTIREQQITKQNIQHNHTADLQDLQGQHISAAAKRKAIDDLSERPTKIIR